MLQWFQISQLLYIIVREDESGEIRAGEMQVWRERSDAIIRQVKCFQTSR